MIEQALAAHAAGLSVVPPREDGTKAPEGTWKQYTEERPSRAQITRWYETGRQGLGIVCGKVSGGLECLEFEGSAIGAGLNNDYWRLCEASGLAGVLGRIVVGYTEETPSGGRHLLYRCEEIEGNQKLARRLATLEERTTDPNPVRVLIETRGEGGFVIVAPSNGSVHPTGRPYKLLKGGFDQIATITPEERRGLLRVARALDKMPKLQAHVQEESTRPGDMFNRDPKSQDRILHLLLEHEWTEIYRNGDAIYLRRPDKDRGISATLGYVAPGWLYVFSTSTEFEAEKGYSPFQIYAILECGGDFAAAARNLRGEGHGSTAESPPQTQEQGASTWQEESLERALKGDGPPPATILHRSDGIGLFYPGRVNSLVGEPESGKSWLALLACVEVMGDGEHVVYIDVEDTSDRLVQRLRLFGVPDDVMRNQLHYFRPSESFMSDGATILKTLIAVDNPVLVVIDAVSEAMALEGLDLSSNKETTQWLNMVPKLLANLGPSVVLIDHVVKSKDDRGRWAIGAQAKLAHIDASYLIDVVKQFAPGQPGELKMKIGKDRGGYVSQYQIGRSRLISRVLIEDDEDGDLQVRILPPSESSKFEPTVLMERVSRLLAMHPDGLPKRAIRDSVDGKNEYIDLAIKKLHAGGWIEIDKQGGHRGHVHKSVSVYSAEVTNGDDVEAETDQA